MNKKGFVVSAVLYPLLVIFLALIMGLLAMSNTRKNILNTMKLEITDSIFDSATCDCEAINNAIKKHSQSILNLENRVSSIEGDYVTKSFLNSKIEDLQNTINNLSNRVSTIENNYVSIATMQTYVDNTVGDKIIKIENTLTSATENINNKIKEINNKITNLTTKTNNLETRVDKIESTLNPTIRLKVGQYVKMVPYSTSYTIPGADTGCGSSYCDGVGDQTINPSELTTWIVIRDNGGTYDMVSEYLSSTKVSFRGRIGYEKYVGILKKIAAQYKGKYIISARMPGYKEDQTESLWEPSGSYNRSDCKSSSSYPGLTREQIGCGNSIMFDDLQLIITARGGEHGKICTINNKNNSPCYTDKESYWVSGRVYTEVSSTDYWFGLPYSEDKNGDIAWDYAIVCSKNGNCGEFDGTIGKTLYINSLSKSVRPIVTLGSQYYISGGDGSKNNPYVLE